MGHAGIGHRVEGVHAVDAAVSAGRVRRLFVEASRLRRPEIDRIVATARERGARVEVVDDVRPLAETSAPQGIIAEAKPIPTTDLETLIARDDPPVVVVLDRLEDPRNVGAIARSLLAAGITSMVVGARRSAPLGATAFKAAAGALEHVAVASVSSIADAVARLGRHGLWRVGLDAAGTESLFGHRLLGEPLALVLGAEGGGLSDLVSKRLDTVVRIPLAGPVESLNASAAATLAAFEVARVRGRVS